MHAQSRTGPRGNSKFPFMLLIIRACCYFMGPCKPLNYCTLKCIPTLLRERADRRAFHCPSEGPGRWTTKEHDSLIIFNGRIKMVMKLKPDRVWRGRWGGGRWRDHKVICYGLVVKRGVQNHFKVILNAFFLSLADRAIFFR